MCCFGCLGTSYYKPTIAPGLQSFTPPSAYSSSESTLLNRTPRHLHRHSEMSLASPCRALRSESRGYLPFPRLDKLFRTCSMLSPLATLSRRCLQQSAPDASYRSSVALCAASISVCFPLAGSSCLSLSLRSTF